MKCWACVGDSACMCEGRDWRGRVHDAMTDKMEDDLVQIRSAWRVVREIEPEATKAEDDISGMAIVWGSRPLLNPMLDTRGRELAREFLSDFAEALHVRAVNLPCPEDCGESLEPLIRN